MKLVFDHALQRRISHILAPFKRPEAWKELGLSFAPVPSAVVLLKGETGTGKSTIANYIGRRLGYTRTKMPQASFGDVAQHELGGTEKAVKALFHEHPKALLLEEVDGIAWDSSRVTDDTIWMLGIRSTLLSEIDAYLKKGGCLLMATNHAALLDKALLSRVTDTIILHPPTGEVAEKMWRAKLPRSIAFTPAQIRELAAVPTTPRDMEHRILRACRAAFDENRMPSFEDFLPAE